MIKFIGVIDDNYNMIYEELPEDAVLINEEKLDKMGFMAGILGVILSFLLLLWKQHVCNYGIFPLRRNIIFIGCIIGLIMLGVHEILHLLPYPKESNRYIALNQGKLVSFCAAPITKTKFLLSSFLPILLGVIPILLFVLIPSSYQVLNTILWTSGAIGLGAAGNDYIEILIVAVKVPRKMKIISGEDGFYYYK